MRLRQQAKTLLNDSSHRKSPVLAEMEAKAKLGKDGSGHSDSMERTDSGSKAECAVPTQTQRELAPPWDFNDAEHHLQLIK